MSFSLVKAIFVNRAPFKRLELDFKENGINVLSAINGNGKTTILSHITDAFYELAKKYFTMNLKVKRISTIEYLLLCIILIHQALHMYTYVLNTIMKT